MGFKFDYSVGLVSLPENTYKWRKVIAMSRFFNQYKTYYKRNMFESCCLAGLSHHLQSV